MNDNVAPSVSSGASASWGRLLTAVLALAIGLASPSAADAIVGGELDGTAHPYVAFLDVEFDGAFCTAVLVSNRHLLTSAHCVADLAGEGVEQVSVTFESTAMPTSTFHPASTWHVHPTWDVANNVGPIDVAVITLDAPVAIAPAQIAPAGLLDLIVPRRGTTRVPFTVVGYGQTTKEVGGGQPPTATFDFTRRQATQWFHAGNARRFGLTDATIGLTAHANSASTPPGGTTCAGDSGAPILLSGTSIVVALHSEGTRTGSHNGNCVAGGDLAARVDTFAVQAWLQTVP